MLIKEKLWKIACVHVKSIELTTIVVVNFILKRMIRINRLVKKSSLIDIVHLPHVSKIEILRGKANQANPNVVRIQIYLAASHTNKAYRYNPIQRGRTGNNP